MPTMIVVVLVYLAGMLFIGWWCNKKYISGMTDFLLAGRGLGLWLCSAALAATHFGGGALMGGASYGFTYGVAGAWYGISTGLGLLFLASVTARRFRELALYTVPDYLELRYGGKTVRVLGAVLSLVALVGILAAQVAAAQSAFSVVGLQGPAAAMAATAVFVTYTATGGLWAAAVSDIVQIAIAGAGVVLATIVVLMRAAAAGGMEAILAARGAGPAYFHPAGIGPSMIVWLLLPTIMYTLIGQDFYQRLFAAKSSETARRAAFVGGVFLILISLCPAVIGMGARGLSDLDDSTQSLPWVLQNLLNPLVGGVILAAILAAIMSTADSLLTAATSHVVKDIWIETVHVDEVKDERRLLGVARICTVVVGLAALILGLRAPGIIAMLIYSYTLYTAAVFVPVMGGVLWRAPTRAAALAAIVSGTAVAVVGIATGADVLGIPTEIYAAITSAIVFVIATLLTGRQPAPTG